MKSLLPKLRTIFLLNMFNKIEQTKTLQKFTSINGRSRQRGLCREEVRKTVVEKKELESLVIDVKNNRYELNGTTMKGVSRLNVDFENGRWTLLITKDEMYQTASAKPTE